MKGFLAFLWEIKWYWLIPLILIVLICAALLLFLDAETIREFNYRAY